MAAKLFESIYQSMQDKELSALLVSPNCFPKEAAIVYAPLYWRPTVRFMTARIREGYLYFHLLHCAAKTAHSILRANYQFILWRSLLKPSGLAMFELRHPVMKAKYLHNLEMIFEFPRLFIHAIA